MTQEGASVLDTNNSDPDQFYQRVTNNVINKEINVCRAKEFTFCTYNCEGLFKKQEVIKEIISMTDADIISIQESYLSISTAMTMRYIFPERELLSVSGDNFIRDRWLRLSYINHHGVASIVKNDLMKNSTFIDCQSDRILMQRLSFDSQSCLYISIYFPPNSSLSMEIRQYEELLGKLSALIENNRKPGEEVILAGDVNCCYLTQNSKRRQAALDRFVERLGGTYYIPRHPTHVSRSHNTVSWLDAVITTPGVEITSLVPLTDTELPSNPSSHLPLLFKVKINGSLQKIQKPQKYNGPFIYHKKPDWNNISIPLFQKIADNLQRVADYVLRGSSWELRTKVFCDAIAHATELAALKPIKENDDIEEKRYHELLGKLKSNKVSAAIEVRKCRKGIPLEVRGKSNEVMLKAGVKQNLIMKLREAENKRNQINRQIRIKQRDWLLKKEMKRLDKLEGALEKGQQRPFFKILNSWVSSGGNEFPDKLIVNGKLYCGPNVMEGFEQVTKDQSEKEMMTVEEITPMFVRMKKFNVIYEKLIKFDGIKIREISDDEILKTIKKMRNNKAPDLSSINKETVMSMSKKGQARFCELVRDMIKDPRKYSATMASTSVASFLYKKKGRPRDDPTSYRKLSIGSFINKVVDELFSEQTQDIAQKNQPELQFGFSRGVNYLTCGVLRETIVRQALDEGKNPLMLACDIKNAFSRTSREAQMFELHEVGERSRIWEYSKSTYTNTYTVVKNGRNFSSMMLENRGSKQGGKKSPVDFKSYNGALFRMIQLSGLGLKVAGEDYGCIMCADDALSLCSTVDEMREISRIYSVYGKVYSVEFCLKKTILNRFSKDKDNKPKEEMIKENIQVGGVTPNYDKESTHLGMIVSEDLGEVNDLNISNRMRKTDGKMYGAFKEVVWSRRRNANVETKLKLYTAMIRPSLLTGLNALPLNASATERISVYERQILRKFFNLRTKGSSVTGLYKLLGLMPIEGHLHQSVMALFYSIWSNNKSSVFRLMRYLLNVDSKTNHWIHYVRYLCRVYNMPDPNELMGIQAPSKQEWKKYVKSKITHYHERKIDKKLKQMSSTKILAQGRTKLNGVISPILRGGKNFSENNSIVLHAKMLTDEYVNQCLLHRIGKSVTKSCRYCKNKDDNNEHIVTECKLLQTSRIEEQYKRVINSCESIRRSDTTRSATHSLATSILLPNVHKVPIKMLTDHLKETRKLIWLIHFSRSQDVSRAEHHLQDSEELSSEPRGDNDGTDPGNEGSQKGETNGKGNQPLIKSFFKSDNLKEFSTWGDGKERDQFLAALVNVSSTLILLSTTTPSGRAVYGRYGVQRPENKNLGLREVKKIVSIVSNTPAVFSAIRFHTTSAYNFKNLLKISEMAAVKILPSDFVEAISEREKSGWRAGSVALFGNDKSKINVTSLFISLRDYPYVEVFVSEANEHMAEIYAIDTRFPRNMCKTDSLRITPRVFVGYTKTFRMLDRWLSNLDEDTIRGRLPEDGLNQEMETSILATMELCRPGSTSYILSRFTDFLSIQGPVTIERLRTLESWSDETAGLQFVVANLSNPQIKEVDMSKSQADKRDAEDIAVKEELDKEYTTDEDNVFSDERKVEEVSDLEGFGGDRIVKMESDKEEDIKKETLEAELRERSTGPLRMVPKERLLSADGLRAHRTGKFLDLNLKRRDSLRADMENMVDEERAVKSECSDFCPLVKEEYESEPTNLAKVTFKEIGKLPESTGESGYTRETIKTVMMTEAEFSDFLKHKAFKKEKSEKKLKRKALIKRLKKENKNLMREVKKSVKRKLVSESDEEDSDDSYSSDNVLSPKRRKNTESDEASGDEGDRTLVTEKGSAEEDGVNNNSDVIADIDSICGSDQETKPLVKDDVNWMTLAKKLSRKEKESISERFSNELRLLSTGEWLMGLCVTMIYVMLLQVLQTVRNQLQRKRTTVFKVYIVLYNGKGDQCNILKELMELDRIKGPGLVILPKTPIGMVKTRNTHGAFTTTSN